jgi:tetraacyldisaccharide 4'-kinase
MILKQPKFWNSKFNLYSLFLLPLTFLYFILIKINEFLKKLSKKKLNLKIICCGNILIGGTGKTPLAVMIYNELSKEKKCCTIKKHRTEHDDGSQDYSFEKNINILCIKSKNGFGNEYLLPSGPLREPMTKIKNYKFAIINGKLDTKLEDRLKKFNKNIDIYYSKYEIENKENYLNKKYLAFSGIANNTDFFDFLEKNKIKVIIKKEFPDHHIYNEFELNELLKMAKNQNLEIITTEKDYCRLNKDFAVKVQYLKLKLEIENFQQFLKNLKNEIN